MRAYRALLRLFPASFRLEYGDEMAAIFARRRRAASGPLGRAGVWLEALRDVLANAARVHLDVLRQDLRYAARTAARAPGFATTAVVVAALGVGATTATFSITDHVLIRPLPYADPSRLVMLWEDPFPHGSSRNEVSPANYRDWKALSTSFEALGAYRNLTMNLVGDGDPQQLNGVSLTADVLPLLGRAPLLGRIFTESDAREGAPGTALLSHALWTSRFAGDPGVLGRTIRLNDEPHTVIGIMPSGFRFPSRETQVWTAFRLAPTDFEDRTDTYIYVVAKRKRDVPLDQARAELRLVAGRLESAYPPGNDEKISASVVPLREHVSVQSRMLLRTLFGASLCVLLIACTNLAGLLIARGAFRRKELAVRTALGAGRERLVRQLLTESLILAACGGALGVMLATTAVPLVTRLVPNALPIAEAPPVDLRVLGFAALVTALTGIGFGVIPALRASRDTGATGLREGTRTGSRSERLRSSLVVAEVTASVVLLVSAGLLIRALWRVQHVDPGFRAENVLTLRTALPQPKYKTVQARHDYYSRVLDDVRALPGVAGAAYITGLPMVMRGGIWNVEMPGRLESRSNTAVSLRFVTPGFFETLGIPLRAGRDVQVSDTLQTAPVAVVSESFTRRHWPGEDGLGRRFHMADLEWTVVGIVGDVRVRGLERPSEPQLYLPYRQVEDGAIISYPPKELVVRSPLDEAALLPSLRRIIARADPQQPISGVRRLVDVVADDTAPRSVQVRVLAGFAALAILLAGIGIHGLLAFTVSQRQQEFGVRMALGAVPRDILRMVLQQGVALAVVGVAAGVVLAYAAGRTLQALLAGVSPADPVTFLAALALALLMTALGSLWPALRASHVDPLKVMRVE
jgi:putative ABC transport system permease protein